jgi:hypothetical protein
VLGETIVLFDAPPTFSDRGRAGAFSDCGMGARRVGFRFFCGVALDLEIALRPLTSFSFITLFNCSSVSSATAASGGRTGGRPIGVTVGGGFVGGESAAAADMTNFFLDFGADPDVLAAGTNF